MRYRPMAGAQFCDRWFADGVTAEALSAAPVVVFNRKDLLQDKRLQLRVGYPVDSPRLHVPDLRSMDSAHTLIGFDPDSVDDVPLFWQQWKFFAARSVANRGGCRCSCTGTLAPIERLVVVLRRQRNQTS